MAHEILSVKLCELDDRLGNMHTRILMSETASHKRLQKEIAELESECTKTDRMMKKNLRCSKTRLTAVLSEKYEQIERTIQEADLQFRTMKTGCGDDESSVEEKILLAEYALDFAQQAAERALLISLEAIDAQLVFQQKEKRDLPGRRLQW